MVRPWWRCICRQQRNYYPQAYWGSPNLGVSSGYSDDLENFLTALSVSRTQGRGGVGPNVGMSGGAFGGGFGTKGFGVTYGFGPYNIRNAGESFRPTTDEFGNRFPGIEAPALPPDNNSGNQSTSPASGNSVVKFLDSFKPTADEFGSPFPGEQGSGGVLKYGPGNSVQDAPLLQPEPNDRPERSLGSFTYDPSQGGPARPPTPSQPSPDGSLSLNDAYLEYLRRLNA